MWSGGSPPEASSRPRCASRRRTARSPCTWATAGRRFVQAWSPRLRSRPEPALRAGRWAGGRAGRMGWQAVSLHRPHKSLSPIEQPNWITHGSFLIRRQRGHPGVVFLQAVQRTPMSEDNSPKHERTEKPRGLASTASVCLLFPGRDTSI